MDEIITRVQTALLSGIDWLEAARQGSLRELWRAALALEHVILSDFLTEQEQRAVLDGMHSGRRRVCQDIFCDLETMIESSFATVALGGGETFLQDADSIRESYLVRYEELARGEIALSGMTSSDQVLFVGSGPFPITSIEYVRQTGCRVDCVDCVPAAVDTAQVVLERLGMSGSIRCRLSRGEHVPASEYSVVMIGVLARPKQDIFGNIDVTCPDGCRILARTTSGLRNLIYEPADLEASVPPGLDRIGINEARGDQVISAVLYEKHGR